jgi:hypothetical protein
MRADDRGVDHRIFIVAIRRQMLENPLPRAAPAPPHVAGVDHAEIPKTLGQVAPGKARPITVKHRLHE